MPLCYDSLDYLKTVIDTHVQAYPLYATIGLGCVGAVLYLGRLALAPDTK